MSDPGSFHIQTVALGKRFGGAHALEKIDLAIRRGEIHGLVGENGAGKSTLGRIIAGAIRADSGSLLVDGRVVSYRTPREALRDGIAMIAQEVMVVPRMSVIENVFLGNPDRRPYAVSMRDLERRYEMLDQSIGFMIPPHATVGQLALGDQQKVEILRALARDAKLIVMDEPTATLTRPEAQRLFEAIRTLHQRGTTIIYISHFLEEVLGLADTVTILRDGKLVRTAAVATETRDTLIESMLGRSLDRVFPEKTVPSRDARIVLSVRGLTQGKVLRDVSLDVAQGEIVVLTGLIGSGRSEVAHAIFGASRANSGQVTLNGHTVVIRSTRGAIRKGMALVPESRRDQGLLLARTIVENVTLAHLSDVSWAGVIRVRQERIRVAALMQELDVRAANPDVTVARLSGGNQQKVLFGKWLFRRPQLLIADEPTRGVDVGAKQHIYWLLSRLASEGVAVLLITSELEEVIGLAHRVLVMRQGSIVAQLSGTGISEEALMMAAFGGVVNA